jgi:GTP-binding nuclear protein Ran
MGENLQESYYIGAHAAIMMFDVTTRESYRSIPEWYRDIISICN